jgi:hypothetical protein
MAATAWAARARMGRSLRIAVWFAYRAKGKGERGDCGPGGDLLFHTLGCSTIGAEGFHGRVRDGIGCLAPRYGHQAGKTGPRTAAGLQPTGLSRGFVMCGEVSGRVRPPAFARAGSGPPFFHGGLLPPLTRGKGSCRYARAASGAFCESAPGSSADRAISTGQLRGLPRFHLRPIDVVVYHGSSSETWF